MCGITLINSLDNEDVVPALIKSLEQLQNRGYDSVGIAYHTHIRNDNDNNGKIEIKKYASTNMVYTLINTIKKIDDDIIITYSDIVYDARNINKIINNKSQFITLVDKKWKALWKSKNKLESDSETLKIKDNFILELGKKTKDIRSVQARYVGLTKISKKNLRLIKAIYLDKIKKNPKRFLKIDMTNFFNFLFKINFKLNYLQIVGKWDEFDDESDYKNYL